MPAKPGPTERERERDTGGVDVDKGIGRKLEEGIARERTEKAGRRE